MGFEHVDQSPAAKNVPPAQQFDPNCPVETGTAARANTGLPHRCCWTLGSLMLLSPDWPDRRGMGARERTGNPVDTYVVEAEKITSAHAVGNHPHRLIGRNSPSSHALRSPPVVSPRAQISLRRSECGEEE